MLPSHWGPCEGADEEVGFVDTVGKRVGEGEVVGIGELVGDALVVVGKSVGTNVGDSVSFSSSLLDMDETYL